MRKQILNFEDIIGMNAPNNYSAECSLLNGVINRPDSIKFLESFISSETFFDRSNSDVWTAIMNLYNNAKHIDMITVSSEAGRVNNMITPYQVMKLASGECLFDKEILETGQLIKELEIKRNIQKTAIQALVGIIHNEDVLDILEKTEQGIENINNSTVSNSSTRKIDSIISECELELQKRIENKGDIGIKCGITGFDRITGGFKPGELIIIGARPAMGKTATLLKFIKNASLSGLTTAVFSLEMAATRLVDRLSIAQSGVDAYKFRNGFLSIEEANKVMKANDELSRLKIYIDDKANQSVNYIRSVSRKLKKSSDGLDLIAIDYLQLVDTTGSRNGNREQEVSVISRSLKLLAKELSIPVILLCQLNRSVEQRADKIPMLSDLRESGAIEQDADVVCFIRRMYTYSQDEAERNDMDLIIAKQRDGAIGNIKCWVNDSMTEIKDAGENQMQSFQTIKAPF